jgi:hypothetical protein
MVVQGAMPFEAAVGREAIHDFGDQIFQCGLDAQVKRVHHGRAVPSGVRDDFAVLVDRVDIKDAPTQEHG